MSDTEKDAEPAESKMAPAETSTEMLTRLLGQQMELAARRDEQLTMLLQHLHTGAVPGARSDGGGGRAARAAARWRPAANQPAGHWDTRPNAPRVGVTHGVRDLEEEV